MADLPRPLSWLLSVALTLAIVEVGAQVAIRDRSFLSRIDGVGAVGRQLASLGRAYQSGSSGLDMLHLAASGRLRADPELGWINNPGTHRTAHGPNTIGPDGGRLTAPPGWEPAPGAPTIALFGDSFTFGDEVLDEETWGWRLREHTGARVINRGVMGFGLDQIVLETERAWPEPSPDVVILGVTPVVTLRVGLSWDTWQKPWFRLDGDALVLEGTPIPPPEEVVASQPWFATTWIVRLWRERLLSDRIGWTSVDPVATALLDRWLAVVRSHGATPVVAYFPVDADYRQTGRPADSWRQVARWCQERPDLVCVDLLPRFQRAYAEGVPLQRVAHWTPEGNALAEEGLRAGLEAAGLLPSAAAAAP